MTEQFNNVPQQPYGYLPPQPPRRKPFFQRVWFWIAVAVVVIAIAGIAGAASGSSKNNSAAGVSTPQATTFNPNEWNSGSSSTPAPTTSRPPAATTPPPPPPPPAPTNYTFGQTVTYEDGLAITVAPPVGYTPGDYAAGDESGRPAVLFDFTITNAGTANYDPSLFYVTASSGGVEESQIFDSQNDISGSPSTPILPGGSVTFTLAFTASDAASFVMSVEASFDYEATIFTS